MIRLLTIAAASSLAASCAPMDDVPRESRTAASGQDCFFLSQISGYTYAGKDRIRVNVGPGRTYEFETLGSCPDLSTAEAMGFDPSAPGTICRGIDIDLIVPTTIGPRRCPVSMIRRVEPEKPAG